MSSWTVRNVAKWYELRDQFPDDRMLIYRFVGALSVDVAPDVWDECLDAAHPRSLIKQACAEAKGEPHAE